MTDRDFDNGIKEKLCLYTEEIPDLWGAIEDTLERKRRWRVVRRVSCAAVAAAACLVGGLFIFYDSPEPLPQAKTALPAQIETVIPPVAEQIADLGVSSRLAVATLDRTRGAHPVPATASPVKDAPETIQETVQETVQEAVQKKFRQDAGQASGPVGEATPRDSQSDTEDDRQLTSEDIPDSFWDEPEGESERHTSQISILTNMSASSDKVMSRIYSGGTPMHSASQTGKGNAASGVSPLSGTERFDLPLAVGLQFKTALTGHLYAGAGVNMTYLVTKYDALVNRERVEGLYNQLWYVGIPVNLYWNFVDTPGLGVYATVGGSVEKCVYQRYVYGSTVIRETVEGLQYSAAAGMGVEYWFAPRLGFYLDPSVVYYFDNSQPLSIRTCQPLQARLEAGLRFKL